MTEFERFKIEVEGIIGTIKSYSGRGKIGNYIEQLREATNKSDKQKIVYCLMRIQDWYNESALEIARNQFVTASEHRAHDENRKQISEFIDLLSKEDESDFYPTAIEDDKEWLDKNTTGGKNNVRDEIFISHRTTDSPVADMIKDFLVNTGIPNEKIFCSSLPGNDVNEKISPEVKTHLQNAIINILILTQSYYESAFCLNEAGVIWYLDDALALPIGLPEVDHTNMIGFLNSDYKLRRLDNADDIAYLYDEAKNRIGGQEIKFSVVARETQKLKERYQGYLKKRESETEDYIEPADAKHIVEIKAKIEAAIVDKSWARTQEDRLKLLRDRPSQFKCNNLILKDASISNPDINNGLIKVEPYDFSDDGIIVIVPRGDMRKKVKVKGRGEIEVDVFSEVLFRDIEEIDPHGSQNYPYPTLFCRFHGKNPYRRDVYYDVAMGHVIDENQIEV